MVALEFLALFAAVFGIVRLAGGCLDRPHELDADVWSPDPNERAANLKAKTEAWKAGRPHVARAGLAQRGAGISGSAIPPLANPNAEKPPRRLVRTHPMRPQHWE